MYSSNNRRSIFYGLFFDDTHHIIPCFLYVNRLSIQIAHKAPAIAVILLKKKKTPVGADTHQEVQSTKDEEQKNTGGAEIYLLCTLGINPLQHYHSSIARLTVAGFVDSDDAVFQFLAAEPLD